MYSKEEIRQAVSAVQNGNISKWEVIDKAYRKKIEGYCAARSRNASEAEDLAQLTMMDAYRKIGSLRETDKLESWLFGIASHKCKDYNRQSSAQSGLPDNLAGETEEADSGTDRSEPERQAEISQLQEVVRGFIDSLPEEQAEIIRLRYYEGLTVPEIAEQLGENPNTVKSRLRYGEKKLQKQVRDYEKKTGVKLGAIALLFPNGTKAAVATGVGAGSASGFVIPAAIIGTAVAVTAGAAVAGFTMFGGNQNDAEPPQTTVTEAITEATAPPTTEPATTVSQIDWRDLYYKYMSANDMSSYDGFAAIYIDNDDTPEIFGFTPALSNNTLWYISNGEVKEKKLNPYYIAYIKNTGKFRDPTPGNGPDSFDVYELDKSGIKDLGSAAVMTSPGMEMYRWAGEDYPSAEDCYAAIDKVFDRSKETKAEREMDYNGLLKLLKKDGTNSQSASEKLMNQLTKGYWLVYSTQAPVFDCYSFNDDGTVDRTQYSFMSGIVEKSFVSDDYDKKLTYQLSDHGMTIAADAWTASWDFTDNNELMQRTFQNILPDGTPITTTEKMFHHDSIPSYETISEEFKNR